jgi:hypothetical protein
MPSLGELDELYTVVLRDTADKDFLIVTPLSGLQQIGKLHELAPF